MGNGSAFFEAEVIDGQQAFRKLLLHLCRRMLQRLNRFLGGVGGAGIAARVKAIAWPFEWQPCCIHQAAIIGQAQALRGLALRFELFCSGACLAFLTWLR